MQFDGKVHGIKYFPKEESTCLEQLASVNKYKCTIVNCQMPISITHVRNEATCLN